MSTTAPLAVGVRGKEGGPTCEPRELYLLVIALAFGVLFILRQQGALLTSAWGYDSHLVGRSFLLQLTAMVLGIATLQYCSPIRVKHVLVAEGVACLLAYGVPTATQFAGGLLAWFVIMRQSPPRLRPGFGLALLIASATAGSMGWLREAYHFSLLFSIRLIAYTWHRWQRPRDDASLLDYLVYMLAPPLLILPPFLTIIPFYQPTVEHLKARLHRHTVTRAVRHLAAAVAYALIDVLLHRIPGFPTTSKVAPWSWGRHVWLIAQFAEVSHLSYGLLLLHGIEGRLPIRAPLLATNYAEYWSRFQVHQKDLQVALLYNPVLLRLRKINRYLSICIAVTATLVVGNTLLHVLTSYLYNMRWMGEATQAALLDNSIIAVALAATLCLQHWRAQTGRAAPRGRGYRLACWALTFVFAARMDPR